MQRSARMFYGKVPATDYRGVINVDHCGCVGLMTFELVRPAIVHIKLT